MSVRCNCQFCNAFNAYCIICNQADVDVEQRLNASFMQRLDWRITLSHQSFVNTPEVMRVKQKKGEKETLPMARRAKELGTLI